MKNLKLIVFKIIKYILLPFGIIYSFFRRNKNEIIILMYHRVNDNTFKEMAVKKSNFNWQMKYLKKKNYKVISMDDVYRMISEGRVRGKWIVLTFDDGYKDYYTNAFPTLKKYNFPSTLYIVPGFIDSKKVFWWDSDIGESKLMGWSMIKELEKNEIIEIGSHTLNHYDMDKLQYEEIRYELEMSKKILEEKLNTSIVHFCYPRGIYTETAQKVAKGLYKTGVLIFNGKRITDETDIGDLMKLKRIPIQRSDGRYLFVARIKGWLLVEEVIRRYIRLIC